MLLDIRNISVNYGTLVAINSVSLSINEGDMIGLIGSNGAGKSTLIKAINGLKHPNMGEIIYDGKRIDKLSSGDIFKRGVVCVPEGRRLFPKMTVFENLLMGANFLKAKNEINVNLERVFSYFPSLYSKKHTNAGALSGGEQQMVSVGRSIMANPRLLLLDEPTIGLAPLVVANMFETFQEINKSGVTVLIAEQNVIQTLNIVKKAIVLEVGEVFVSGDAKDIAENETVKKNFLGDE